MIVVPWGPWCGPVQGGRGPGPGRGGPVLPSPRSGQHARAGAAQARPVWQGPDSWAAPGPGAAAGMMMSSFGPAKVRGASVFRQSVLSRLCEQEKPVVPGHVLMLPRRRWWRGSWRGTLGWTAPPSASRTARLRARASSHTTCHVLPRRKGDSRRTRRVQGAAAARQGWSRLAERGHGGGGGGAPDGLAAPYELTREEADPVSSLNL